jgi:hypothetical protein
MFSRSCLRGHSAMQRSMHRVRVCVLTLASCLLVIACSTVEESEVTLRAEDLPDASVLPNGSWQSSPWQGSEWVDYPGLATLHIDHTLGYEPSVVLVYLAFDPQGVSSGLAAGDLARVKGVTDTTVTIKNGTKGDYYARIVLY